MPLFMPHACAHCPCPCRFYGLPALAPVGAAVCLPAVAVPAGAAIRAPAATPLLRNACKQFSVMKDILLTVGLLWISIQAIARTDYPYPALSPPGKLSQIAGNTFIEVEYERPSARKRKIFGEVVPWNKVWGTGAGCCTKIRFDRPVRVKGQQIPGEY